MILCIGGKKGSGKSTIAKELVEKHSFKKLSFADTLKHTLNKYYSIDIHKMNQEEKEETREFIVDKELLKIVEEEFDINIKNKNNKQKIVSSARELMQYVGTDIIRTIDDFAHIRATINNLNDDLSYVIDDTRFCNEVYVADVSVYLEREDVNSTDIHISENLSSGVFDFVVNNNSSVDECLKEIMIIIEHSNSLTKE